MRDYGVLGKEEYVANWWKRIDWNEVHRRWNYMVDEPSLMQDRLARRVSGSFERGP